MVIEIGFSEKLPVGLPGFEAALGPRVKWGPNTNLSDWKPSLQNREEPP